MVERIVRPQVQIERVFDDTAVPNCMQVGFFPEERQANCVTALVAMIFGVQRLVNVADEMNYPFQGL